MQLTTMSIWLFIGLAVITAGVLAVLQLLRIRPRRVEVVTNLFWQQAAQQLRARTLLDRFRHPRTYLLLLAVSLLLLLALARPVLDSTGQPHRVIVLEAGLAMTANDGRFENALDLVRSEAASQATDRVAVIVADPQPRVIKHFDETMVALEDRLDKVEPVDMPMIRKDVLQTAKTLAASHENGEVVLVSAQPATAIEGVRVLPAGEAFDNAFVLSATFVPDSVDLTRGTFHCRIGFAGKQPGKVTVNVSRTGKTLFEEAVEFKPIEIKPFRIADVAADGTIITVQASGSDAVGPDSRVDFQLPNRRRFVLAVTGGIELPPALLSIFSSLPEVTTEATEGSNLPVIRVGPPKSDAQIVIHPSNAEGELLTVRPTNHPLLEGLVFEDAICRSPTTPLELDQGNIPLLLADGLPVAMFSADASKLAVSQTIFGDDASIVRRTGYMVFWSRVLHHLAGWVDEPLALSPTEAARCLDAATPSLALKADIRSFDSVGVDTPETAPTPETAVVGLPLWQLLLLTSLGLMIVEAFLNIRGRIS